MPESGDWWDAGYLIMWGSNLPVTRTPDAHWMAEARYRGQKVVAVAPDYADNVKFADEWLPAQPGTDGALAMGHVILQEFFVDRPTEYFTSYVKRYTDLPFLVTLDESGAEPGTYEPGKFLTAADLGGAAAEAEHAESAPCCWTRPREDPWCRTVRSATATASPGPEDGTSTSATPTPCCPSTALTSHRSRSACPASTRRTAARDNCGAGCRCAGWPGVW